MCGIEGLKLLSDKQTLVAWSDEEIFIYNFVTKITARVHTFHRDRGDLLGIYEVTAELGIAKFSEEYQYLFKNGQWYFSKHFGNNFYPA